MFRFATPEYFYLLLLIPLIAAVHLYSVRVRRRDLRRFADDPTMQLLMPETSPRRICYKTVLFCLAIVCVVFALARPQIGSKIKEGSRRGVEIMLAVDVSNSMLAKDFEPSRLERTKFAIDRLIEGLNEERIGLVVFAGNAYMQLPITADYLTARNFAHNISTTMVSRQGTAIGAAIDLACSAFTTGSEGSRALILISDGENHEDDAITAAKTAADKGIRIYTIGIGTPEGAPIEIGGDFVRDEKGEMVVTKLDEKTLENIALQSGGGYIRATNRSIGLEEIKAEIDLMEKKELAVPVFEVYDEQYQYFIAAALILLIMEFLLLDRRSRIFSKIDVFGKK